jgi:putative hydrolase of the HAD superfamily
VPIPRIRVVFFDIGGTLVDTSGPSPEETWQSLLVEHLDCRPSLPNIADALRHANAQLITQLPEYHGRTKVFWHQFDLLVAKQLGLDGPRMRPFLPKWDERFASIEASWPLFSDAVETIQGVIALGYRLGIISNYTDTLPNKLVSLGIDKLFDAIVYSQRVGAEKPSPLIFEAAMEAMGCDPEEAVHIGDKYDADIIGARGVGIAPVLIDRDGQHQDADCVRVQDLREVLPILSAKGSSASPFDS